MHFLSECLECGLLRPLHSPLAPCFFASLLLCFFLCFFASLLLCFFASLLLSLLLCFFPSLSLSLDSFFLPHFFNYLPNTPFSASSTIDLKRTNPLKHSDLTCGLWDSYTPDSSAPLRLRPRVDPPPHPLNHREEMCEEQNRLDASVQ